MVESIMYKFNVLKSSGKGRRGEIITPHGKIETPAFTFCATKGALRGVHPHEKDDTQLVIVNTYHLMKHADKIEKLGGIHKFMSWNGPIISDSGGYQVFSYGHGHVSDEIKGTKNRPKNMVKIDENGVYFKCPITGDTLYLNPEKSIEIQHKLGVDFMVSFDECTPFNTTYEYTKNSLIKSNKWAERSIEHLKFLGSNQKMYVVLQGGIYKDLRDIAIDFVNNSDAFGIAIGGCLGKTKEEMYDIVEYCNAKLRKDRPVHLLGIGETDDLLKLYKYFDTADCVVPTRLARHGGALRGAFNNPEKINLKNARFNLDANPIDDNCKCPTCTNYSCAYLHHLIKNHEVNCVSALAIHNLHYMNNFMKYIREEIL
jgi:queuine tRNA-ribosyltransferase